MSKIFYAEKDNRDYNRPDKYAFLNWCMDDGMGTNKLDPEIQMVFDNYYIGRGYLGNALTTLYLLIEKNRGGVADIMIFPILFDIWHGVEVWLKSACRALEIVFDETKSKKKDHNIYDYYEELSKFLKEKNLNNVRRLALGDLDELIAEFKKVNANFDFARYSFDTKNKYQFYNAPYGNSKQWQHSEETEEIVPNTCVDLMATFEVVVNTFCSFGRFVECLNHIVDNGDKLTDEGYMDYIKQIEHFEELLDADIETDNWEILLDMIK